MGNEDDWKWSDCTPWNWTMWDLEFSYGNLPQPDNYGTENCAMINWYSDGIWYAKWHDVRCSSNRSFVCSKEICKGNFLHHLPQALLCLLVEM